MLSLQNSWKLSLDVQACPMGFSIVFQSSESAHLLQGDDGGGSQDCDGDRNSQGRSAQLGQDWACSEKLSTSSCDETCAHRHHLLRWFPVDVRDPACQALVWMLGCAVQR